MLLPSGTRKLEAARLLTFAQREASDPQAAQDIVRKTGQTGVPVFMTSNRWVVGFDKERIEKELRLS